MNKREGKVNKGGGKEGRREGEKGKGGRKGDEERE